MKFKLKEMFAKIVWKIAGISPKMGNLMMDWFPESYNAFALSRRKLVKITGSDLVMPVVAELTISSYIDKVREREAEDER